MLLLLSGILSAGGVVVIFNSLIDGLLGFTIGIILIFLWIGSLAIIESKYFTKQRDACLKFFGLTANEE